MNKINNTEIIKKIEYNKSKFHKFNGIKLKNLLSLGSGQKVIEVYEIIPYLLNCNHPELPGYVETSEICCGITDYTPSNDVINIVKSKFPSANFSTGSTNKNFIQMLALIGSGGTIAFTGQSDLDYWICYFGNNVSKNELNNFRLKCNLIENWIFESYNIEVQFFLNEINSVKNNIFAEDEKSLAGASTGELLKEEFFRSSIVIKGKIPFWWVVPADCDNVIYKEWLNCLKGSSIEKDFIDLGNLHKIKKEDFLVSALFQLLKSLGSPFKSLIKLGLLERYLGSKDDNPFISTIVKNNIQNDEFASDKIDAYVIMFDHVFDYYSSVVGDKNFLEIIKMAFYLKVEPKLSKAIKSKSKDDLSTKEKIMLLYLKKWNWGENKIDQMDDFQNWGIEPVNKLLNSSKKFILTGYKRILSSIESHKVLQHFTEDQLKGITRKIYSHFLIETNKIDNTLSFKTYPPEKLLKIEYITAKNGNAFWILSKRKIIKDRPNRIIIYKDESLFGLIIWISLNGVFMKDYTRLEIESGLHSFEPNFLRELIADISSHFSFKRVKLFDHYFLREAFPVMSYIIINPFSKYSKKIDDIYFVYHNSWGETKYEIYKNDFDIARMLIKIINGSIVTKTNFENSLRLVSSYPFKSSKEFIRLRTVIKEIFEFFSDHKPGEKRRYISTFANNYFIFQTKKVGNNTIIDLNICDKTLKLLYTISYNTGLKSYLKIEPGLKELSNISTIVNNHNRNSVQIYFENRKDYNYFFVCDEMGALFFFRNKSEDPFDYLTRLYLFSKNIIEKVVEFNPESTLANSGKQIEIFQLKPLDDNSGCGFAELNPELSTKISLIRDKIIEFDLLIEYDQNSGINYCFSTPEGDLSHKFNRTSIKNMALMIKGYMSEFNQYSFYLTGLDLSKISDKRVNNHTSYAFTEKNRFELMIGRELSL